MCVSRDTLLDFSREDGKEAACCSCCQHRQVQVCGRRAPAPTPALAEEQPSLPPGGPHGRVQGIRAEHAGTFKQVRVIFCGSILRESGHSASCVLESCSSEQLGWRSAGGNLDLLALMSVASPRLSPKLSQSKLGSVIVEGSQEEKY